MAFQIQAPYKPAGDQPTAIQQLTEGILDGERHQVLLGVTGSGKTFTVANVIQNVQRPTLVLTHNKTLVAQLYGEFKQFFPENAVEYFVSYYDYYQPEAYMPTTDTYIEKDLNINEELDKLRLRATTSLLSGRRDIIVVASVSCIYGMGNPTDYESGIIRIAKGDRISRQGFLHSLVNSLYNRTSVDFNRGTFRVKGDTVDINLPYVDFGYRVTFFGDEIEEIESIDVQQSKRIGKLDNAATGLVRRSGQAKRSYFNTSVSTGVIDDKLVAVFLRFAGLELPVDTLLAAGIEPSAASCLTKFKYSAKTKSPSDNTFNA